MLMPRSLGVGASGMAALRHLPTHAVLANGAPAPAFVVRRPSLPAVQHCVALLAQRQRLPRPPCSSVGESAGEAATLAQRQEALDVAAPSSNGGTPAASTSGRPSAAGSAAAAASSTAPPSRGARVEVVDMVKHFKTRAGVFKAVDGVTVSLKPGTITALLGPSGSGKTTLLRLIAGLESPTSGRVLFNDIDVTDVSVQERGLGIVFQGYALFKHMTVAENIGFGPRMRREATEDKVQELLRMIQLEDLGGRYPQQLSGGQKQRVAVARALASDPQVLLLDEPFGALDPVVRKSMRTDLQELVKRLGVTTIIVTHDQEEAWDLADEVVVFNRGLVEQCGTPQELASSPATPFVMNFVGDVAHLPASCQFVRRMGGAPAPADGRQRSHVLVRPSDLEVLLSYEEPSICPATVSDKANVGWAVRYWLKFDDGVEVEWGVERRRDEQEFDLEVGQRVYVRSDPHRMMAFDPEEIDPAAADETLVVGAGVV